MLYDSHTHTNNSHDSNCLIEDLCEKAIENGLGAITVSDHADICKDEGVPENIAGSVKDVVRAKKIYGGQLKVLAGIELGEFIMNPKSAEETVSSFEFDAVLGSVHAVRYEKLEGVYYAQINFKLLGAETINAYLNRYFEDVLETAESADVDILAHLTCPLRYINGKYGFNFKPCMNMVEKTLKTAVKRNLALEINTSCIGGSWSEFMPDMDIVRLYRRLGGSLITIGSDAHTAENVGKDIKNAVKMIQLCGFNKYYYFEQRKPVSVCL